MRLAVLVASLPAVLVAALLLAPFHDKAFTIDDTLFLKQAEHALADPLHPTALDVVWTDEVARMSTIMPSGPVGAFLLMPSVKQGGREVIAHATMLLVLLLGLIATASLALELGLTVRQAMAATLLVAVTPAVLAMSATAMPDVPAMSFGVLAMERFFVWRNRRRLDALLVSLLAFALAMLSRPHLVLLPGVALVALAGDEVFDWRGWRTINRWRALAARAWPLLVPFVLLLVVGHVMRDPGRDRSGLASSAAHFASVKYLDRNLLAYLLHWLFALPLVLPWTILRRKHYRWKLLWQLIPAMMVLLSCAGEVRWFFLAPLGALSTLTLIDLFEDALRRRDRVQLTLGVWLLLPLPVVIYNNLPSKFLVACAPAVAVLVTRLVARERAPAPRWWPAIFVGSAALGCAIIVADARFANLGRSIVREWIAPRVARGERLYFAGHWGFQWYAEKAGARVLTASTPLRPGDLVVASERSDDTVILHLPNRHAIETRIDDAPGGRIISRKACAGFWSSQIGYLPWMWWSDEVDRFDIWKIDSPERVKKPIHYDLTEDDSPAL